MLSLTLFAALLCAAEPDSLRIVPFVTPPASSELVGEWRFAKDTAGWGVLPHNCELTAADGVLKIRATGEDPYFYHAINCPGGHMCLTIKARGKPGGQGEVFWTTDLSPTAGSDKYRAFTLRNDDEWRVYQVRFDAPGKLTLLRLDPGGGPGSLDVESIRLEREIPHPLEIADIQVSADRIRAAVANRGAQPVEFTAFGNKHSVAVGETVNLEKPIVGQRPLESEPLEILVAGMPTIRWPIFVHNAGAQTDWVVRQTPAADGASPLVCKIARDGSIVRVERDGVPAAVLGPLVHCDGVIPAMKLVDEGDVIRFQGEGINVALSFAAGEIGVSIDSQQACEGPVVRTFGGLDQGVFAGLEYLGKGEKSSSKLDVENEGHLRYAPDPMKVTMPLMCFVTDRASVAMTWSDMQLQPVYATPNFFECTDDHRMALRGKKIDATIRIDGASLEDQILWAVRKKGLPPLPAPPRTWEGQREICLAGLNGAVKGQKGWNHCTGRDEVGLPYADMASTIWRLTGQAPALEILYPSGAHIPNESIYFATNRVAQWLDYKKDEIARILSEQHPDGSFHYSGKYCKGHYEDTASGYCAWRALQLLDDARLTGDPAALQGGLRTLEYMKRFREPRGAETWELSLHTPDLHASANLVWAYMRGFELTGNKGYVVEARRWAISGLPFIYLWQNQPIMLYGTIAVYGATNWEAPNWIGLPVNWVGGNYAYALAMLAPHDNTLDWKQLARGILISCQQMQHPDGQYVGLLPDSFVLAGQMRMPPHINPCALISLELALDGKLDSLAVAADGVHRIVAPFPVAIQGNAAQIQAIAGMEYQVLIDNQRIVPVKSQGIDVVPLAP